MGSKQSVAVATEWCFFSNYFFKQRTQNHPLAEGQRPKDGFVSKWVYKFLPSQKILHLSGYFKHHIGSGQLPKNMYEIL